MILIIVEIPSLMGTLFGRAEYWDSEAEAVVEIPSLMGTLFGHRW